MLVMVHSITIAEMQATKADLYTERAGQGEVGRFQHWAQMA